MPIPKHLDEAVAALKRASARIDAVRAQPPSIASQHEWLTALTDFCRALSDIQSFTNESVHEKLHELAGRAGLRGFPPAGSQV